MITIIMIKFMMISIMNTVKPVVAPL